MNDSTVKLLSGIHRILFQTTAGRIGNRLVDNDMLLLTTTGRRSGNQHTVPLLYLTDGDRIVVIASYGGREYHPAWYLNLLENPLASMQINGARTDVTATTMSEEDRATWWPRIVDAYADYATYQSRTDRAIPVVWLSPIELSKT
ncbi:MAG: nitroreductase family deazaflavin-dependent oxidoreductase [Acidimicrobiia bacterium]